MNENSTARSLVSRILVAASVALYILSPAFAQGPIVRLPIDSSPDGIVQYKAYYGFANSSAFTDSSGKIVPFDQMWRVFKLDTAPALKRQQFLSYLRYEGIVLTKSGATEIPYEKYVREKYDLILARRPEILADAINRGDDPKSQLQLEYLKLALPRIKSNPQLFPQTETTLYRYGDPEAEAYFRKILVDGAKLLSEHKPLSNDEASPYCYDALYRAALIFALANRIDLLPEIATCAENHVGTESLIPILSQWNSPSINASLTAIWPSLPPAERRDLNTLVAFGCLDFKDAALEASRWFHLEPDDSDRGVYGLVILKVLGPSETGDVEEEIQNDLKKEPQPMNMLPFDATQEILSAIGTLSMRQYSAQLISIVEAFDNSSSDVMSFDGQSGPNGYENAVLAAKALCEMDIETARPAIAAMIKKLASTPGPRYSVLAPIVSYIHCYGSSSGLETALPAYDLRQLAFEATLKPVPEDLVERPSLYEFDGTWLP